MSICCRRCPSFEVCVLAEDYAEYCTGCPLPTGGARYTDGICPMCGRPERQPS